MKSLLTISIVLLIGFFLSTCFLSCDKVDKVIDRGSGSKATKDYHRAEKKVKDINDKLKSRY